MFTTIIYIIISAFIGYLLGRIGDYISDYWLNDPWSPHHWIYGVIIGAIAILFFQGTLELLILAFGVGVFISDLKDFWQLKFIGKDNKPINERKFWHIN